MHHHISKTMENSKCKPLDPQKILMKWSESFAIFMDHCYSVRFLEVSYGFFLISDMDNSSFSGLFFLWFSMCIFSCFPTFGWCSMFFLSFSKLCDGFRSFFLITLITFHIFGGFVQEFSMRFPFVFHAFSMFFPWFSMFFPCVFHVFHRSPPTPRTSAWTS